MKPRKLNVESLEGRQMMAVLYPGFRVSDVTVNEGDSYANVTITKDDDGYLSSVVNVRTASGSAGSGDFSSVSTSLTFKATERSKTVRVPIKEDTRVEGLETFAVNITASRFANIKDGRGVVSIIDNDTVAPPPTPAAPNAPSSLTATALGETSIRLNWQDNATNETGFLIERSANGTSGWSQIGVVLANVTTLTDTGLTEDTHYYYRVRATNDVGASGYSGIANATTESGPVDPPDDPPPAPTGTYGPRAISQPAGSRAITSISNLPSDPVLWLRAGTYNGTISLRAGQRLVAENGAILNLGNSVLNIPSNASVENLDIRGGRPLSEWNASVMLASGAKLINCEVSGGYYTGVMMASSALVEGCDIHDNRRTGIKSDFASNGIVRGNDIHHNNPTKAFDPFDEAGGSKFWATTNFLFENNKFRDNIGNGLWLDYDNRDYVIRGNQTSDNTLGGIFVEISYAGLIENNSGTRDGKGYNVSGWGNGAAIVIENSSGTASNPIRIRNNTAIDCTNGIMIIHVPGRSEETNGGNYKTEWIDVSGNTLTSSGKNGWVGSRPSNLTWSNNVLSGNSRLVGV